MLRAFLLVLSLALLSSSCKKTGNENASPVKDGTYKGTFQRLTANGGLIVNVSLNFKNGNWSGQGETSKYPALCHGRYQVEGDNINFINYCIWTAEFDWTLILEGDYKLSSIGNQLEISRDYNGAFLDVYKLTRQ